MSAYVSLGTPMIDQDCLLAALTDLGLGANVVEVHPTAVALVGYEGTARAQKANIVIRRRHVGRASNDIGFERTATGFRAHVSEYDRRRYGAAWLKQLQERYQHHDQVKQDLLEQARKAADLEARRQAEIEARRREEERQRLVEAQCQAVHEKARRLGYRVEESRQGDTVRLVLLKRVY